MAPKKPVLHPLKTPKTTLFPSELFSDSSPSASETVRHGDGMNTPITPPAAYTEFLKALTPVFNSPASAGMNFPRYPFDRPANSPTSQPASAISSSFPMSEPPTSASTSFPPPTPASATSASTTRGPSNLRRLRIPQSLRFSPTAESPESATTVQSPFSPSDWKDWKVKYLESTRSNGKHVSVRHVVTHTVTFKRTKLDDPPKGKRRKGNDDSSKEK